MCPRLGRPKSDNPQNIRFEVRIDKQTQEVLTECAKSLNVSRSEVVKKGIMLGKDSLK